VALCSCCSFEAASPQSNSPPHTHNGPALPTHTPPPYSKALLDDLLLEVYAPVAALGTLSPLCTQLVLQLAAAAAAHCSPRDALTALLEAMDAFSHSGRMLVIDGSGADPGAPAAAATSALLAGHAGLLAPLLARLRRHRCAFLDECLCSVNRAAEWVGRQPEALGAGAHFKGGLPVAEMVRQWRPFVDFVCDANTEVVATEPDEAKADAARDNLARTALLLLAHLTLGWAAVLTSDPSAGDDDPVAEATRLLDLLRDLGAEGWEGLEEAEGAGGTGVLDASAAGAALAALYSMLLGCGPEPPAEPVALLRVGFAALVRL